MLSWMITSSAAIALVLLIRRIFKGKISARTQYGLWLLVLIRLLIPFNLIDTDVSILHLFPARQQAQETQDRSYFRKNAEAEIIGTFTPDDVIEKPYTDYFTPVTAPEPAQSPQRSPQGGDRASGFSWQGALMAVWAAGVGVMALVLLGVNVSFRRRLCRARRLQRAGGKGTVPVYVVEELTGPCLFGLICPAIYLPGDLTEEQMPYVLAHEESHCRMKDPVWSLFRSLCLALHWYNPLVWLAAHVSRQDSELACDERTVNRLGEECRSVYGRVLVEVTVQQSRKADFLCCATAMTADGKSLKERVQMIAKRPRTLAVTGVVLAILMLGIFCVACTGVRGGDDADRNLGESRDSGDMAPEDPFVSEQPGNSREGQSENDGESQSGDSTGRLPGQELDNAVPDPDPTDPASDHVRSENAYYRVIRDTVIDDPYFTMEVSQSLVGQVAYGAVLGENEEGERYLRHLALFHIDSLSGLLEGEPQNSWHELATEGCLAYCFWTGYPDLEPDLEQIAFRSGTWDIRGMEFLLAWDYDQYAGVGGTLLQANQAGTGAYFYMEPTSVEYDPESPDAYTACLEELRTCWSSFSAKQFPYEELEGYSMEEEIPRWRQDFEEAERAFSWFTTMGEISTRPYTNVRPYYKVIDGVDYGVVDEPGITSMEELRAYLNRYFDTDITEALLSGSLPTLDRKGDFAPFVEEDGQLLAMVGGVGQYHYADAERQYASFFWELDENGNDVRPHKDYVENGKSWRALVHLNCQCNWSMWPGGTLPQENVFFLMLPREDGSWYLSGRYELPISLTLAEAIQYGTYTAVVDGKTYTLTLNRNKIFDLSDDAHSTRIIGGEKDWYYWEDDMLILRFRDTARLWYFQQEENGWNITFRADLSTLLPGDPLPDGAVFEKIK